MTRSRTANDVQTAVRMPSDLYKQLKTAAGDRPLGEEIRRRLEASFGGAIPASTDPKTAELVGAIVHIADSLQRDFKLWHKDRFAYEVMKHTVAKLLRFYPQPEGNGDVKAKFNCEGIGNLIYPDNVAPETVADILVAIAIDRILGGRAKP